MSHIKIAVRSLINIIRSVRGISCSISYNSINKFLSSRIKRTQFRVETLSKAHVIKYFRIEFFDRKESRRCLRSRDCDPTTSGPLNQIGFRTARSNELTPYEASRRCSWTRCWNQHCPNVGNILANVAMCVLNAKIIKNCKFLHTWHTALKKKPTKEEAMRATYGWIEGIQYYMAYLFV